MLRKFILTNKVEDLNGAEYSAPRDEKSTGIHADNVPTEAMQANFLKNCAEEGLILFDDYGL